MESVTGGQTPASPSANHRFGELAVDMRLLTDAQLAAALEAQRRCAPDQHKRIGEILYDEKQLELRQIHKILLEQKRRRGAAERPPADLLKMLGHFEILAAIGSGGMSSVYQARDTQTGRIVALKVLSSRLAGDAEFVTRFQREVQAAAVLQHPHIVAAFGSGSIDGQPYLAMEFVSGQSLGRMLQTENAIAERKALEIARAVALALGAAHERGIIHRDVKPDNVLLAEDGAIKLTDFGLAKLLEEQSRLTETGIALGTPHYISPEQVAANRYVDHRADLYGLGAMLYHMVTGQVPFDGPNNNDIMLKHLEQPPADPRSLNPMLSAGAALVIYKLLAKKSAERYDSAADVIEDIDCVLRGVRPVHAQAAATEPQGERTGVSGCAVILMVFLASLVICIT